MDRDLSMDDPCELTVTVRLSNAEVTHHIFQKATAHMRQNFLVVHHEKDGKEREDWFHGGTVIRVSIQRGV